MCILIFAVLEKIIPNLLLMMFVFFSSRRRHTRFDCDWSSDVCSSDLFVYVRVFHVADGAGNVEDELQYFRGTRQCFWRSMDFAGEHAMQEIIDEVFFAHQIGRASCRERV